MYVLRSYGATVKCADLSHVQVHHAFVFICIHHRQGSWKTGEKEVGTYEESKKLEENHQAV